MCIVPAAARQREVLRTSQAGWVQRMQKSLCASGLVSSHWLQGVFCLAPAPECFKSLGERADSLTFGLADRQVEPERHASRRNSEIQGNPREVSCRAALCNAGVRRLVGGDRRDDGVAAVQALRAELQNMSPGDRVQPALADAPWARSEHYLHDFHA